MSNIPRGDNCYLIGVNPDPDKHVSGRLYICVSVFVAIISLRNSFNHSQDQKKTNEVLKKRKEREREREKEGMKRFKGLLKTCR